MSVYNGKRYIREQLDSIVNQKCNEEIQIFIRDDGSPDDTFKYIEDYSQSCSKKMIVYRGQNKGASGSFMEALRNAPNAEFYAFCDQDDVWIDSKLQKAIAAIKKEDNTKPVLWTSNFSVVDSNLCMIKKFGGKYPIDSDLRALFYNNIPGCTMVFNQKLMSEIRKIEINHVRMHDIVAINIALILGKVIYDSTPMVLYRQHGDNVLGYGNKKIKVSKWLKDKIKLLYYKEPYDISEYAKEILRLFNDCLTEQQRKEYELIKDYKKMIFGPVKLLNKEYTKTALNRTGLSIRCKIFMRLM